MKKLGGSSRKTSNKFKIVPEKILTKKNLESSGSFSTEVLERFLTTASSDRNLQFNRLCEYLFYL